MFYGKSRLSIDIISIILLTPILDYLGGFQKWIH